MKKLKRQKRPLLKRVKTLIRSASRKSNLWLWLAPLGIFVVAFATWLTLSNNQELATKLFEIVSGAPNGGFSNFLILASALLAVVASLMYFFVDYQQHLQPFKQEAIAIAYAPLHHARVVVLPRMRYNWKRGVLGIVYGVSSLLIFTFAITPVFAAEIPVVTTTATTSITQTTATLNGTTTPAGVTERGFDYGLTASYGSSTQDSSSIQQVVSGQWGGSGSGDGQFSFSAGYNGGTGIAMDSNSNIYIVDSGNHRVQKFDTDGNFIAKWGSNGISDGQFSAPYGIGIDEDDNVYVSDAGNSRIQKFDTDGNFIAKWGSSGTGNGQFAVPAGIVVDSASNVYVVEAGNHRVQKFDSSGNYITKWGSHYLSGAQNVKFNAPTNIFIDEDDNIYVFSNFSNGFGSTWIKKYSSTGTYITGWTPPQQARVGAMTTDGKLLALHDGSGEIYEYDLDGNLLSTIEINDELMSDPYWMLADQNGNLYVTTNRNADTAIQLFRGGISSELEDLECGTTYHYRAYATNSEGTSYGDDETFQTEDCPAIDPSEAFITTWKTDNPGSYADNELAIGTDSGSYSYDFNVDWGDGNVDYGVTTDIVHTYDSPGTYQVMISGDYPRFMGDPERLLSVDQWGPQQWQSMESAFQGAINMTVEATDTPDLSQLDSLESTFAGATSFNQSINDWDVSTITNMVSTFAGATSFNQPLGGWNTSSVVTMDSMFAGATAFDQNINGWNLGSLLYMSRMFQDATSFNQPLNDWNTISVTHMEDVFMNATSFNQPLNSWNVSNVTTMRRLFNGATAFNQPLNNWDTGNVIVMWVMFAGATSFNQPLDTWETSSVVTMTGMFQDATSFNRDISAWDVSGVTDMGAMFYGATAFNQPLNSWNVSSVTNMSGLFGEATAFNQPLNSWNVSNVTNMSDMFYNATSFDQSLGNWNVVTAQDMANMFQGVTLSMSNYDDTLIGWSNLTLQNDVTFDGGSSTYCAATAERQDIIDDFSWTITDGGEDCSSAAFVTTWKTDNPGFSNSDQITIPTTGGGYNYNVEWEEVGNPGNNGTGGPYNGDATITFPSVGTYEVKITGDFPRLDFRNEGTADWSKILSVEQWGTNPWSTMEDAFWNADNLQINATDTPDLSNVSSTSYMFFGALDMNADISDWDVSNVTDMSFMFSQASSFNQPLNDWNVGSVTNMQQMFELSSFNQPLNDWDVSNVTNMIGMFYATNSFNQPLNNWNTSSVTDMSFMFRDAVFNEDISSWNTGSVTNMSEMFRSNDHFNQSIDGWNVSSVTNMSLMFRNAASFNQPLNSWNVSSVINMQQMFGASLDGSGIVFNQPLNNWNTSSVTNMSAMFLLNRHFNQPLNNWNTSSITDMSFMFGGAIEFNQSLDGWNTSSVTDMSFMFGGATSFDQSLGLWDVSNVTSMDSMFLDQTLNPGILDANGLSTENYDDTLIGWSNLALQTGVTFDGGLSTYCVAAEERTHIMGDFSWTITDGGEDCSQQSALNITTTSLPNALMNSYYSAYIETENVIVDASFSITNGSLPTGLVLEDLGSIARISGTPTQDGTFNFTIQATDDVGSDSQVLSIEVEPEFVPPANDQLVTITSPGSNANLQAGNLTIQGTGPADKIIEIYLNDVHKGGTRAESDGEWTYIVPNVSAGQYNIEAKWEPEAGTIAVVPIVKADEYPPHIYTEIKLIDTSDDTYVGSRYINGGVSQSVINQSGDKLYLATGFFNQPKIYELDLLNGDLTELAEIDTGGSIKTMTLSSDGTKLYVSGQGKTLSVLDITSKEVEEVELPTGTAENSFESTVLSGDGLELYIPSVDAELVAPDDRLALYLDIIDTETLEQTRVSMGEAPFSNHPATAIVRVGNTLYVNYGSGEITVFDTVSRTVTRTIDLGLPVSNGNTVGWIIGLAYSPHSNSLYATQPASGLIQINLDDDSVDTFDFLQPVTASFNVSPTSDGSRIYIPWVYAVGGNVSGMSVFDVEEQEFTSGDGYPIYSQADSVTYALGGNTIASEFAPSTDDVNVSVSSSDESEEEEPTPETTPPANPTNPASPNNPSTDTIEREREEAVDIGGSISQDTILKPENLQSYNGFEKALINLARALGATPQAVIWALPWLLIALLLALIALAAIRALWQLRLVAGLRKLVARQELLNHEKRSLLALSSHYLRTPLTILSSGLEMLSKEGHVSQEITSAAEKLRSVISRLTTSVANNQDLAQLNEPQPKLKQQTAILQPAVIVPVAVVTVAISLINVVVMFYTSISPGWINFAAQIVGVILFGVLLQGSYRFWLDRKALKEYQQQLYEYELTLDSVRNRFIKDVSNELVPAVVALDEAVPANASGQAVGFFKEGLRQLEDTIKNFILIGQLEQKTLQQRAEDILVKEEINRVGEIQKEGSNISIKVPDDTVVKQPEFLVRRVFGSLIDNATSHSEAQQPVEVKSHAKRDSVAVDITDHGGGIASDKLETLFKPLSRVESAEDFTHQGIGLSLYVDRLIMHYLGGEISAESSLGKGTTMKLLIPKQLATASETI